jgi:nucleotide-binding universal stress UspA family protein
MTRRIVVGLAGNENDVVALAWTAHEARADDVVHVVYPYRLLALEGSSWYPAVRANDARRARARRVVAAAISTIRSVNPKPEIDGSAIVGRAVAILRDLSQIADLLVVVDDVVADRIGRATGPRIGRAVAATASCPVVVMPRAADARHADAATQPVALLLTSASLPADAVRFAFESASARAVTLIVAQSCASGPTDLPVTDDDISSWEQVGSQEILDADLSAWQEKYHAAGVIVEVRRESPPSTAMLLDRTCQLIVVPRGDASRDPLGRVAREALRHTTCPVAVVPETAEARADAISTHRYHGHDTD